MSRTPITYVQSPASTEPRYRVGFVEGWPVSVHKLLPGIRSYDKDRHLKIEVTSEEGQAAVKSFTGGTMRWYGPALKVNAFKESLRKHLNSKG